MDGSLLLSEPLQATWLTLLIAPFALSGNFYQRDITNWAQVEANAYLVMAGVNYLLAQCE